jgi:hypothetical protein
VATHLGSQSGPSEQANTITISGGRLEGNGTIVANVATHTIAPGVASRPSSNGHGRLDFTSTATLQTEVGGGVHPGTEYDLLTEAGTVPLTLRGAECEFGSTALCPLSPTH